MPIRDVPKCSLILLLYYQNICSQPKQTNKLCTQKSSGLRTGKWRNTVFNERKHFEIMTVGRWIDVFGSQLQRLQSVVS